jgi:hypothetical protein
MTTNDKWLFRAIFLAVVLTAVAQAAVLTNQILDLCGR